ncbi:MAG: hypothetical protein ACI9U2_003675, partial [Bradymonadia bacterium]
MLCGLNWACGGGDDGGPRADAEVEADMEIRVINDMAIVDAAPLDMGSADMQTPGGDAGVEPDLGPRAACADGLDNDRDGLIDFPDDPGCE